MSVRLNAQNCYFQHKNTKAPAFQGQVGTRIAEKCKNVLIDGSNMLFEKAEASSVICNALLVFFLTTTVRPAAILAMPGSKKEDREYAAAKSIATGFAALLTALVLFRPIDNAFKNIAKRVDFGTLKDFPFKNEAKTAYKYIIDQGSFFVVAPIQAMVLINTIPPIMNRFFPKRKTANPGIDTFIYSQRLMLVKDVMRKNGGTPNV